jgi:hypothetical protein
LAGKNSATGLATDIGVEERSRHTPQGLDLQVDRDGRRHRLKQLSARTKKF